MGFVPQESTFWTAVLWRTVGGLDASLRLAGDWDLWRRMAAHQPVFTYDTPVGLHRRHAGQLSEDLSPYHREVDRILAGPAHDLPAVIRDDDLDGRVAGSAATLRDVYRIVREQDGRIRGDPAAFRRSRHVGKALVFNSDLSAWSLLDAVGTVRVPEALVDGTQLRESASVEPVRGFGPSDGPYLQYGLDKPVRWMDGKDAVGRLSVETAGEFEIRLVCRNWIEGQQLSLLVDGSIQSTVSLPVRKHEIDLVVTIRRPFTAGNHELVVRLSRPSPSWQHLLVKSWTAVPIAGAAVSNEP